jgi:hypothetical protein
VICGQELTFSATSTDNVAIVGDECHIISGEANGPRYDASYAVGRIDSYENLILLCRVHHKMVDDQSNTYTAEVLRQKKRDHEASVKQRLSKEQGPKPLTLRRIKENTPDFLVRITTGKQLIDLVSGAYGLSTDHDDATTEQENDLIGGFFQELLDWMNVIHELEPAETLKETYRLTLMIQELEQNGLSVFGGCEKQILEGGTSDEPLNWPVAVVQIVRNDSDRIIQLPEDSIPPE